MNKQPELTERTRRCIIDAYWKLLMNKEKRSVISVSRAAAVNRSTFYQYFLDMDDLREQAETQMLEDVKEKISVVFPQGFPMSLKDFAIRYASILEDEAADGGNRENQGAFIIGHIRAQSKKFTYERANSAEPTV